MINPPSCCYSSVMPNDLDPVSLKCWPSQARPWKMWDTAEGKQVRDSGRRKEAACSGFPSSLDRAQTWQAPISKQGSHSFFASGQQFLQIQVFLERMGVTPWVRTATVSIAITIYSLLGQIHPLIWFTTQEAGVNRKTNPEALTPQPLQDRQMAIVPTRSHVQLAASGTWAPWTWALILTGFHRNPQAVTTCLPRGHESHILK